MDDNRARELLTAERARIGALLADTDAVARGDRVAEAEPGDLDDDAQPLASQGVDDAVTRSLRERLEAVDRAENRLAAGTFGRSVRSGDAIPDERLEVDPAAELTVEEAAAG